MKLTIQQAAARLGVSERQIRYLIQQERLKAAKPTGRWEIDSDELPKSEGQAAAEVRKQEQLKAAVLEALDVPATDNKRYSIRDMKAFQVGLQAYRTAYESIGHEHPATLASGPLPRPLSRRAGEGRNTAVLFAC